MFASANADGVLVRAGTTTYTQDLAAPLSQILADGSAIYVYGAGSERLRAVDGPWYVGDALGSVRTTLDDAGTVLATAAYDPWGVPQGALLGPFGFTGELHHGEQVYLRARWYTPGSGTFPSRDPFAGWAETLYSLHAYQYAYSAPTVWTDPTGENPLACLPIALVDTPVPGPADAVAGVCFVFVGGLWLIGTLVALTQAEAVTDAGNRLVPRHTGSPQSPPPPLAFGPPGTTWNDLDICVIPGGTTLLPPDTGIWPGPDVAAPPGPFTTGAPFAPVHEVQIYASTSGWDPTRLKTPATVAGNTPVKPSDQGSVTKQLVIQYANAMRDGTFDWGRMRDKIVLIRARNGTFIEQGHHRFLASRLSDVEIPEEAIVYRDYQSFDWPVGTEWTVLQWN